MRRIATLAMFFVCAFLAQTDKESPEQVVRNSNAFEFGSYQEPMDQTQEQKFRTTVVAGSVKEADVVSRIERARKREDRLKAGAVHRIDKVVKVTVSGNTATVETLETSHWQWEKAGSPFDQEERQHTYYLRKVNDRWLINEEQM